jgi:inosine/xanthosine triphosphatase
MDIVVASLNPAKISAVSEAFSHHFPAGELNILPLHVDSGVSDQPVSDEETRKGACNRARNARLAHPKADYWIGLEGGVEPIDGQLMTFAWMAVLGTCGNISECRSVTLPLPPAVSRLMDSGLELGEANDRVFSTVNSKHEGGAFGLLTNGRYTREGVYAQTLSIALIPFVNSLYEL